MPVEDKKKTTRAAKAPVVFLCRIRLFFYTAKHLFFYAPHYPQFLPDRNSRFTALPVRQAALPANLPCRQL